MAGRSHQPQPTHDSKLRERDASHWGAGEREGEKVKARVQTGNAVPRPPRGIKYWAAPYGLHHQVHRKDGLMQPQQSGDQAHSANIFFTLRQQLEGSKAFPWPQGRGASTGLCLGTQGDKTSTRQKQRPQHPSTLPGRACGLALSPGAELREVTHRDLTSPAEPGSAHHQQRSKPSSCYSVLVEGGSS